MTRHVCVCVVSLPPSLSLSLSLCFCIFPSFFSQKRLVAPALEIQDVSVVKPLPTGLSVYDGAPPPAKKTWLQLAQKQDVVEEMGAAMLMLLGWHHGRPLEISEGKFVTFFQREERGEPSVRSPWFWQLYL